MARKHCESDGPDATGMISYNLTSNLSMQLSVIEAFYGKAWDVETRVQLFPYLKRSGYQAYVYAPKSASKLRRIWSEPFTDVEIEALDYQRLKAGEQELKWGIGFTPLGLDKLDPKSRGQLNQKLKQIAQLKPDSFCLLFDDMQGDRKALAVNQLEIIEQVAEIFGTHAEITVCPTYYSTDPILEQLFGQRPKQYWEELGRGLDPDIDLFWTGEKVCSSSYDKFNLEFISNAFRRAPALWDNYPVNDSKRLSTRLLLKPFSQRESWLKDYLSAHFVNPMNQAWLSLLPLSTLEPVYAKTSNLVDKQTALWQELSVELLGDAAALLAEYVELFHESGLTALDDKKREQLTRAFNAFDSPLAKEVVDWLNGVYAFDEACLTD